MQPLHRHAAWVPPYSDPEWAYQGWPSSRPPHHQPPYSCLDHNCRPRDIRLWRSDSCGQYAVPCHQQEVAQEGIVFSKARLLKMKEDMQSWLQGLIQALYDHTAKDNWEKLKSHLNDTMAANIPTKMKSMKWQQPWMTADICRKSRRSHQLYKKCKRTGRAAVREAFQSAKRETSKWVKRARVNTLTFLSSEDSWTVIPSYFGRTWRPWSKTALGMWPDLT